MHFQSYNFMRNLNLNNFSTKTINRRSGLSIRIKPTVWVAEIKLLAINVFSKMFVILLVIARNIAVVIYLCIICIEYLMSSTLFEDDDI